MRKLQYVYSALIMGLMMMLVILWMPWLIAAAVAGMVLLLVMGLVAWFWFGRKVRKMVREVEKEMQQQQAAGQAQNDWSLPQDTGASRMDPRQQKQGPVIHIQPEEVPRRD